MSDLDSENIPSEAAISRALRDQVIAIYRSGNTDDLTVKRVRARAESSLVLPDGFLKNHDWKQKSSDLIREAVEEYCSNEPESISSPATAKKDAKRKTTAIGPAKPKVKSKALKRKSEAPVEKPKKRQKAVSTDEESEAALSERSDVVGGSSEAESEVPKKTARRQPKVVKDESDEEDIINGDNETTPPIKEVESEHSHTLPRESADNPSDSDMSSLLDESPVKKRRQKAPASDKSAKSRMPKETGNKAKTAKSEADSDPDQAEIKRLQGWLVKCGIRKVWGKELAKCDTAKAKIRHLREMLQDAGMEGKYSNEKAARIKEKREFAKDLEEIQAGAAAWGKDDVTDTGRPRRRANKPAQKMVLPEFSDEEDGARGVPDIDEDDDSDEDDVDVDMKSGDSESDEAEDSE